MSKKKETARKDEERPSRAKPGPSSQARSEKRRRREDKSGANASRGVPRVGKRDSTDGGGDSPGNGLH
jgi:hypothetical protein